ncbi:MAG: RagB/SusD family nutrient uptake outer membrane protein [Rikenellaceae bacterium]|nr:RagB/SusD family nutrient uptake outer membrane protein [Rikenellaceae bacterium]
MKKYNFIPLWIATLGLVSCSDFLEPKSNSEMTPKTVEHLNEMILGEGYPSPTNVKHLFGMVNILDDDVAGTLFPGATAASNPYADAVAIQSLFTWLTDYSTRMYEAGSNYYDCYSSYYQHLKGPNAALDMIDHVTGEDWEKLNVIGQAHALRAFLYLQLANLYGKPYNYDPNALAVPLKTTASIEDRAFPHNTVGQVYELILQDLHAAEEAYTELWESGRVRWSTDYRTSLPMVQLLLSRVYLYMEEWSLAAEYAAKVMEYEQFSLLSLAGIFTDPENNRYYNFISYANNPECIWVYGSVSDMDIFTNIRSYTEDTVPRNYFQASPSLLSCFEKDDLRLIHYMVQEPEERTVLRAYGKYAVQANEAASPQESNQFGNAFRLSEAYLNYAEAHAMLYRNGQPSSAEEAVAALNELRRHRFTEYTALTAFPSAEVLIEFVRQERRRELCWESHRWFDLRRYGMPEITHYWAQIGGYYRYTLTAEDPMYTLPLPFNILNSNSDLVQDIPLITERTGYYQGSTIN